MKRKITRRLSILIIIALLLFLAINYVLQMITAQNDMVRSSKELFWQIDNLVEQNEEELDVVKEDIKEVCLIRAKAAAYIFQEKKEKIKNLEEINKIVDLLQIDEVHIFNKKGTIYSGSEPEYYGLKMDSGEQIRFFKPMLKDKSMSLCQDITANTAEKKMMQYAAVWMEDGSNIVQIGMEPERVIEQTMKNEVSYVFSCFANPPGSTLLAVNPETDKIVGSTDFNLLSKTTDDLGIDKEKMQRWEDGFHCNINGKYVYCVFQKTDSVILGRTYEISELYRNVNTDNIRLIFYMVIITAIILYCITHYLDRNIVRSISDINDKLQHIAAGNLDERVTVENTPEFALLSDQINHMVKSILETTDTLGAALDATKQPIGIFEYNQEMERVRVTTRVSQIFGLSNEKASELFADHVLFEQWVDALCQNPLEGEEGIFILEGKRPRYIRVETFPKANSVFGIVIDRTDDIRKKRQMEMALSQDELTKLCSRRAFYVKLDEMFAETDKLKNSAVIMIDADDLKKVNDTYGHGDGDRYLCGIADLLDSIDNGNQITARLGGDEFAILIYGKETQEELDQVLQKLYDSRDTNRVKLTNEHEVLLRYSIGVALVSKEETDYHVLLKQADLQMYQEKKERKRAQAK